MIPHPPPGLGRPLGILLLGLVLGACASPLPETVADWLPGSPPQPAGQGAASSVSPPAENLLGGRWEALWTRQADTGKVDFPTMAGTWADTPVRLEHSGSLDWSLGAATYLEVDTGDILHWSVWVHGLDAGGPGGGAARGSIQASLVLRDTKDQVLDWMAAMAEVSRTREAGWVLLEGDFLVPPSCTQVQFRLTGNGPGNWLATGARLERRGHFEPLALGQGVEVSGGAGVLRLDPSGATLDYRASGRTWQFDLSPTLQRLEALADASALARDPAWQEILSVSRSPGGSTPALGLAWRLDSGRLMRAVLVLEAKGLRLLLQGEPGTLKETVWFPGALLSRPGDSWVLPVNEGLLLPAADRRFATGDLELFGGHGLSMPFVALSDGLHSLLVRVEDQNDALARYHGPGQLGSTNQARASAQDASSWEIGWWPEGQAWGGVRQMVVEPVAGDYVQVAKAYRRQVGAEGRLRTLEDKAKTLPRLGQMAGAVNLWWWKNGPAWEPDGYQGIMDLASQLQAAGVDRVLWSGGGEARTIQALNALGWITGRYDIYQDVWGPDNPNTWVNRKGWPDDLVLLPDGRRMSGWVDRGADGQEYPGGVLCSAAVLDRARKEIGQELATLPFTARFLDTTTASPLRECWNPLHPQSRSGDRRNKMALLSMLEKDFGLIGGSETGMDLAVPYLCYFEGMESLGPYRLPDAGYDLFSYKKPQEDFLVFQTGSFYRIPLFQLVYHDCVFSSWYWGDSSNRVPEVWDRRDMINALYGTLPLWAVDQALWQQHKDRFIKSWYLGAAVSRQTAFSELLDHRFESPDHQLQSSRFADGTRVRANFDTRSRTLADGLTLQPESFRVDWPDGRILESWNWNPPIPKE